MDREVVAMVGRGVANRQRMLKAGTVLEVVPKVDAAHKLFKGDWFSMKREEGYTLIELLIITAIM